MQAYLASINLTVILRTTSRIIHSAHPHACSRGKHNAVRIICFGDKNYEKSPLIMIHERETFRFISIEWDVTKMWRHIEKTQPTTMKIGVSEKTIVSLYGPEPTDGEHAWGMLRIDRTRAITDPTVDPNVPIILVSMGTPEDRNCMIVDGAHRYYKAWKTGKTEVDAYVFDETSEVKFRTARSVKPKRKRIKKSTPSA